ncbi:MAG: Lrp/AsnC ligand binding domain-containing protein [Candidatus Bathyarchaeia archaeon]
MDGLILIRAKPDRTSSLIQLIRKIPGIRRAFQVYGQFDIVAFVEAPTYEAISRATANIHAIEGINNTETLIEAVSERDVSFRNED